MVVPNNQERILALVQAYQDHYQQYRQANYNETELRVDFVNPFFQLMGWDVLNERGLPQHIREVTHEATVVVEEQGVHRNKKPDYSFKVGTETFFFAETKKPSVDITSDGAPAFQLRRYGWSGNLKISILTNFTDLYIYDCSIRPQEHDDIGTAMVAHYHYTEYAEKYEELYQLISKDAILDGSFQNAFGTINAALRHEPFDAYFLGQIKNWRGLLGHDLVQNNAIVSSDALNIFVQRVLNRIIFLRICEDRNLENYEQLKRITSYIELKNLFISADRKYDSGLFDLLDEEALEISDDVILAIFRDLYYPNSSYEFSVVDPYIIGQIYELFLDEVLAIDPDGTVRTLEKPESVDSQGAVNTPKNITDIIVEQTLTPLFAQKDIDEIRELRIADICCGSGNFLLSTFEYIINYYIELYRTTDLENALRRGVVYQTDGGDLKLSFAEKRQILVRNVWGVDIDPLAVEVAKFSLFLKVLEDTSFDGIQAFVRETHQRILPSLDGNIKNGNSLVNYDFAIFDSSIFQNTQLLAQLKMFDWNREFGGRKFDAIVGNPPYIRVQNMVKYSPKEYMYYKRPDSEYATAKAELLDKYYLFIERGLSLLVDDGLLGYIVPHKFMTIKTGRELRAWLTRNQSVKKILHFGTQQVFKNRSTYTCILVLSKCAQDQFEIGIVHDLNHFIFNHEIACARYSATYLSDMPWTFLPDSVYQAVQQARPHCVSLSELAEVFVGMQTSADDIYIIKADREDATYIYFTDTDGQTQTVERALLRKCIYDKPLLKYEKIQANCYIIYPYKIENGKTVLIPYDEMAEVFPRGLGYLNANRDKLNKRNMPSRKEDTWYAYGRSQSVNRFSAGEHLIWPVLSLDSNYVYENEQTGFTGGGNGPYYGLQMKQDTQESIFYVQAILNHWLPELLVKKSASTFRGDYYSHGKQFVATLPVYKIDFGDPIQKGNHDLIVAKVHMLMSLLQQKSIAQTRAQKDTLARAADAIQQEITRIIDSLYGITEREAEE